MAPLVAKDKVVVGISGGEYGVRGWIQALDANSGKSVWKAYNTGPDQDVKIGPDFKPFYDSDKGKDLGVTTWPPDAWEQGGGTVWGWITYDPDLNLIYYGTGNPGPWNPNQRPGRQQVDRRRFLPATPTPARRAGSTNATRTTCTIGTAINEHDPARHRVEGQRRKVLVHPGPQRLLYVIDRTTGEVLSAKPSITR